MKLRQARKIDRGPKAGHTYRTRERAARRLRRHESPQLIIVSPKKARDALTALTMQRYLNHTTAHLIENAAAEAVLSALYSGEVFA